MQSIEWKINTLKQLWLQAIIDKLPETEIRNKKTAYIKAIENAEKTKQKNIS